MTRGSWQRERDGSHDCAGGGVGHRFQHAFAAQEGWQGASGAKRTVNAAELWSVVAAVVAAVVARDLRVPV